MTKRGKNMFDVTALGELLIDFTPCGVSEAGMALFEQNPGGAPANVLAAVSNLGLKPAFIGKVGKRLHIGFDDPSHATGTPEFIEAEFRRVRDEIKKAFARFYITEIRKEELPACSCGSCG